MNSEFDALWQRVNEMGAERVRPDQIKLEEPPSVVPKAESSGSVLTATIRLDELDGCQDNGGLLSYQGKQVLVYIPDQGVQLDAVLKNPMKGTRFHVSHCKTLEKMASENRNHRYSATNDTSGTFLLEGDFYSEPQKGRLLICKNCLSRLNYQGYANPGSAQQRIFNDFDLTQFFANYSSLFHYPYARQYRADGVASSKPKVPPTFRAPLNVTSCCSRCQVSLPGHMSVSHSPNDSPNRESTILCRDCDRRQNWQDAEPITADQMRRITRGRREQKLLDKIDDWQEAFDLADPAYHGLMRTCQRNGWAVPEVGLPLTDAEGVVLAVEFGLAWESRRVAVVLNTQDKAIAEAQAGQHWQIMTLGEAMRDCQQDGDGGSGYSQPQGRRQYASDPWA